MKVTPNFLYVFLTKEQAKQMNAVWNKKENAWRLPNTLGALRELYKAGYDVVEYGKNKAADLEAHRIMKKNKNKYFKLNENLREYQQQDVSFLSQLPHAAVFNEQRTGKSPTILELMNLEKAEKIIIVVPASLLHNWKKEIEQWTTKDVLVYEGTPKKRKEMLSTWGNDYLVVSYGTLKADIEHFMNVKNFYLILDEAHRLRNYQTQQSKACFRLGRNAIKRIAMTGTPSVKDGSDIYGILHFLYPDRFNSYWQFAERYFKVREGYFGGKEIGKPKREQELTEILDVISVQRKRKEVMAWIPKKQYQVIPLAFDKKQEKVYNEMKETFVVEQNGVELVDAPSVLAQLTRLRQICLDPSLLGIEAPSAKETFLLEWLDDNPSESVVVFSTFSSYLKKIHKKVKGSEIITGEQSPHERQQAVQRIQSGKSRVLFANILAAGVGLTIDRSETVIFLDRDFTVANNSQAEDRIVPTTLESNQRCTIIDLVIKGTVDDRISDILRNKRNLTDLINNYRRYL